MQDNEVIFERLIEKLSKGMTPAQTTQLRLDVHEYGSSMYFSALRNVTKGVHDLVDSKRK
jgi:hypothetical protein